MKRSAAAILIILFAVSLVWAVERKPIKLSPKDKCPVCGMFVAKYPDFVAQVIFKDGSYAVFDGAKDMFKYYFDLKKYAPAKRVEDIVSIYVTDYYSLEPTDGLTAWYVVGSDVFGPMGKELIPFAKETDARGFMKDHKGKSLLRFNDVHVELIKGLD
jgi:copper chaperone NosL